TVNYTDSQSKGEYEYIADVLGYENGYAVVEMRNRFKEGDVLEVLSPWENFGKTFVVGEAYDSKNNLINDAKLVKEHYRLLCPFKLKEGEFLRRKSVKKA
ncbi:MAG: U32 family peptidase C-terminal domain-containing protein, partial [Clostridia bacterium]|nr:U32 family peptidase C-terminal domain-containing protein [Clostridia bacterium]